MRRRVLGFGSCCYHVVSRINERRFYLGEEQKHVFYDLLRRAACFSGVHVLTYCIMNDHFHLLVYVPMQETISDQVFLRRLKVLYSAEEYERLFTEFEHCRRCSSRAAAKAFRDRFERRMYDLSEFMSTLKQRFSIWYNLRNSRHGPLWDGRFKSVLVQSLRDGQAGRALAVMAAYIDLNALRAGLVEKPDEYSWCGCGSGGSGRIWSLAGLRSAYKHYRRILEGDDADVMDAFLQMRSDFFSKGWIFGDAGFVADVMKRRPECFRGGGRTCVKTVSGGVTDNFCVASSGCIQ